jgi:hypothetical protein
MSGVRVLGQLSYVPPHIDAKGKEQNARVTIPVRANSHRGFDRNGQPGRKDDFKLTAFGKLADTCCRSCSPGKALDVVVGMNSFMKKVFNPDGSLRLDQAGQVIETAANGYTIQQIVFGEESRKFITEEIQNGLRPADWDVPGSPGSQHWANLLQQKSAMVWDGNSPTFGFARVVIPQGIRLKGAAPVQGQAPAQPQAQQFAPQQPVYGGAPLPNQVNQALPPQGQPAQQFAQTPQGVYAPANAMPQPQQAVPAVGQGF